MSARVALVATTTATDGGDVLAARLGHLLARGWDARLLCRGERLAADPVLQGDELRGRVERSAATGGRRGPFDRRLLALRPELVHFHSATAAWKSLRVQSRLSACAVVSVRDDGRDLSVPDPQRLHDASAAILFPSQALLDRAADQGWPAARAEVLESPVITTGHGRPEAAAPAGPLRLLSVGPLAWEHGLEHAIHAVAVARDHGVACTYRIVGEGDGLHAVSFAIHQLGLGARVALVAPADADSLAAEIGAADVLVDPSVTDAFGRAVLAAAQSVGIPVISTRAGLLGPGAGVAVARRSHRALANAIEALAADPALRGRMGAAGRLHGARRAPLAEHLDQLEDVYRRALARG